MELVQEQQFGQLTCIFTVVLVSNPQQSILTRITNQHFGNVGFQKIAQPSGTRSFFEAHAQTTAQTMNKLEDSGDNQAFAKATDENLSRQLSDWTSMKSVFSKLDKSVGLKTVPNRIAIATPWSVPNCTASANSLAVSLLDENGRHESEARACRPLPYMWCRCR
jgi:hypothetical protein